MFTDGVKVGDRLRKSNMTYEQALKEAERVGAANSEGLALLAMTAWTLSKVHAINPKLVYDGAIKKNLTSRDLLRLPPVELGDLMFI